MKEKRNNSTEKLESFQEANESYNMREAIAEAQRCLNCKVPQCKKGCPIGNDIPEWIHELSKGNLGNAMQIINNRSNLPAVCGRVCAHERQCEGNCVLGKRGRPVNIGMLERFIADFDGDMSLTHEKIPEKTRGRVAVIGSGPSGLTIAGELSRKGYAVEMFEMESEAGGVLMYGIPEYRLPKAVVRREIARIEQLGVNIHLNTTIGKDLTIDSLFAQGFDAIFMATGTAKPKKLDIKGADMPGVRMAVWLLRRISLWNEGSICRDEVPIRDGHRVCVIGGGNTAMDAARSAIRMGAGKVFVVYHRTIDKMTALRSEYEEAVSEGVEFLWEAEIEEIVGEERVLKGVLIKQKEKCHIEPADLVVMAVGAVPASRIVNSTIGIEVDEKGFVCTCDFPYGMTSRKGVFAGGDVAGRHATVVHAMQDAKRVAEGMEQYLDAVNVFSAINDFAIVR